MILSTQYYRAPFPLQKRWQADLTDIRKTGFDAIYVTAPWSWIEPEPDKYVFDDLDELIERAGAVGLGVIVNLWSEVQPAWIHRILPEAAMIDHMGRAVISSQLAYIHFGLMPGCCTDHPAVREKASSFLRKVAERFSESPYVLTWDCWNEMRWMSQADGYVCYCHHTIERFRSWLKGRYGSLDGLNNAWNRRYSSWLDVQPAKSPTRTYLDAMVWQEFLADRTASDLRWRYEQVRAGDGFKPVIAHAAFPSVFSTGEFFEYEPALARGNDWELAKCVDGYGCSHFPGWIHQSPVEFGSRIEAARSATGDKPYWIAELQGGAAGHGLQAMRPVPGSQQARWVWNSIARGAKGINFWCWRDEVFSRESAGFGIVGEDGCKADRLENLSNLAKLLARHKSLFHEYRPAAARVAVVFEPQVFRLDWASYSPSGLLPAKDQPYPAGHSLQGYLQALERLHTAYDVIDSSQTGDLESYRLLILPWPLVVNRKFSKALIAWIKAGGTLLVEGALDAFDELGRYQYPDERPFVKAIGLVSEGRRLLGKESIDFSINGIEGKLQPARWLEPWRELGQSESQEVDNSRLLFRKPLGAGNVIAVGSFIGLGYWEARYADFESFVRLLVHGCGAEADVRCDSCDGDLLQWRFGISKGTPLLFIINEGEACSTLWRSESSLLEDIHDAEDLITGSQIRLTSSEIGRTFEIKVDAGGSHVVRFGRDADV